MGFFDGPEEALRIQRLKALEDKRLRFAQRMKDEGFAPESMLAASTEFGGVMALCCRDGQLWLIAGPDFGSEDDFILERCDASALTREEICEKPEGLGGVLGFGKRGAQGFVLHFGEREIPFVAGRSSWAAWTLKRNPLLQPARRRGDANVVWDMQPLETRMLKKVEALLKEILDKTQGGTHHGK